MKNFGFLGLVILATMIGCSKTPDIGVAAPARQASMVAGAGEKPVASKHLQRFGTAENSGNLMVYPKVRAERNDGAYTWVQADVSETHALAAIGGTMSLVAPSGQPLQFKYRRHTEHDNGDWTWIGTAVGDPTQEAIITFGDKAAFGSISQPGKEPLRLTTENGVSWLVETDPAMIRQIDNSATRPTAPDFLIAPDLSGTVSPRQGSSDKNPMAMGVNAIAAAGSTVDLVIGYTPGFMNALGGASQAQTRLNFLVDITNQAYTNSQINASVRLVKTMLVDYPDATPNVTALNEMTSRPAPVAAFSELRAAREQYGADLVSLVRQFNEPENQGCGVAWLLGGSQSGIDQTDAPFGYSVVSDGRDAGSDGSTYFCREETFAHELGHNMGSSHDRNTADGSDNILQENEYGVYPYSFGYNSSVGNFYTIMAYGDAGQTRYRVFSNPRITSCGGVACGLTDQADNARSINNTIPAVANFRAAAGPATPPTAPEGTRGDANADGRADFFWHNPGLQQFQPWYMNGATWTYGGPSTIPSKYRISAVGDFNGDRRADIIWHDTDKTELWAWIANEDNTYTVSYLRNYPTGWEPVSTGDANGDGRADIFWHNIGAQGMQVWLMNGTTWIYGPAAPIASQYRIASVGDFNGDNMADILWRDVDNTTLWQWQAKTGGGYSIIYMRDYPRGWSIVATGDNNLDGKADVFWHNPDAQASQLWFMQGAGWLYGPVNSIPSQYRVATSGDFNGDGRMDIAWTDKAMVWTWSATAGGAFGVNFLRDYPTGWLTWNHGSANYSGGIYTAP